MKTALQQLEEYVLSQRIDNPQSEVDIAGNAVLTVIQGRIQSLKSTEKAQHKVSYGIGWQDGKKGNAYNKNYFTQTFKDE